MSQSDQQNPGPQDVKTSQGTFRLNVGADGRVVGGAFDGQVAKDLDPNRPTNPGAPKPYGMP